MERTVVNFRNADWKTYSLQGCPQEDIFWHNISWSDADNSGFFLVKFLEGGVSIAHEHLGFEEFIILEGELEDHDGFIYRQGDCVSLREGTKHFTRANQETIVGVVVRGGFRTLVNEAL